MLTPSDIRNKRFEKGMGGYKVDDVHAFLNEVADSVEDLYEEREDLEKKLEILAEKVEQYREDEDSLRAALIGAQKLGDSVVRDSKRKAEAIIAQATLKAEELVAEAQASIDKEAVALTKMQMEVAKFKTQILDIYKRHIELIQEIPYDEEAIQAEQSRQAQVQQAPPPAQSPETPFVANIGETVEVNPAASEAAASIAESVEASYNTVAFDRVETIDAVPEPQQLQPEETRQLNFKIPESDAYDYEDDDEDEEVKLAFERLVEAAGPAADAETGDDFPRRKSKFGTLRFGDAYDLTRKD